MYADNMDLKAIIVMKRERTWEKDHILVSNGGTQWYSGVYLLSALTSHTSANRA